MAANISIAGELLKKMSSISHLKNFSYRQYCQALTERDAVQLADFTKLSISEHHDIELRYCFTDGVFNPSHVIDYFARYTDKNCDELRDLVIKNAKHKREHWVNVASIVLSLKPLEFDSWCDIMSDRRNACDELFLFMLCEIHNRHAAVFTSNRTWSTVKTDVPMTEDQVYAACDLHLVYLGQDVYGELMLKSILQTALEPTEIWSELTDVKKGEAVDSLNENSPSNQANGNTTVNTTSLTRESDINNNHMEINPVKNTTPTPDNPWIPPIKPFILPLKILVVEYLRTCTSPLVNPVIRQEGEHSKPHSDDVAENDVDMKVNSSGNTLPECTSDEDVKSKNSRDISVDLDSILKQTCKERRYSVDLKIWTQTEINRATGVVPNWSKLDPYSSLEEQESTESSDNSEVVQVIEPGTKQKTNATLESAGRMTLRPRKRYYATERPRRSSSLNTFYRDMCSDKPSRPHKQVTRRVMPEPSNERIKAAQWKKRRGAPMYTYPVVGDGAKTGTNSDDKRSSNSSDPDSSPDDTTVLDADKEEVVSKGSFKTKTFGVKRMNSPKKKSKVKGKTYGCPECTTRHDSVSALNLHYKDNHEPVKCTECDQVFNTPSTLRRHKYTHQDLKFKCMECKKGFPFESDLKIHAIKHESVKKHACKDCEKTFFQHSDLLKHEKVHTETEWKCSMCDYTTLDERYLKSHRRVHSVLKPYMCQDCLMLFKYHTQLNKAQGETL